MSDKQDDRSISVTGSAGVVIGNKNKICLLYTSDAADDLLCVDLGGRRIIKKKINTNIQQHYTPTVNIT